MCLPPRSPVFPFCASSRGRRTSSASFPFLGGHNIHTGAQSAGASLYEEEHPQASQATMNHSLCLHLSALRSSKVRYTTSAPLPGAESVTAHPACRHLTALHVVSFSILCRSNLRSPCGPPGPLPSPHASRGKASPSQRLLSRLHRTRRRSTGLHFATQTTVLSGPAGRSDPRHSPLHAPCLRRRLFCHRQARQSPGVSPAVSTGELTDGRVSTLMPPFLLASGDLLSPPPGLCLKDVYCAQTERSAHAPTIFTSPYVGDMLL
ncbi:hypothetical protein NDU88_006725 [Pleurodeles waltl]|uniref:Uncharacterized protein n=1 Tax=Pleurodeles waltl TaxID=8319 RepID=A0AAV7NV90_PLEWA|nr:hypothetical protein NDU88_006725 [Pleurodeles waltl]